MGAGTPGGRVSVGCSSSSSNLLRRLIAMCDRLNLSALSVSAEPRLAFEWRWADGMDGV